MAKCDLYGKELDEFVCTHQRFIDDVDGPHFSVSFVGLWWPLLATTHSAIHEILLRRLRPSWSRTQNWFRPHSKLLC